MTFDADTLIARRRCAGLKNCDGTMARKLSQIDRDKLHAAVRTLGNEHVFYMLEDAIELLPPAKLYNLAKK